MHRFNSRHFPGFSTSEQYCNKLFTSPTILYSDSVLEIVETTIALAIAIKKTTDNRSFFSQPVGGSLRHHLDTAHRSPSSPVIAAWHPLFPTHQGITITPSPPRTIKNFDWFSGLYVGPETGTWQTGGKQSASFQTSSTSFNSTVQQSKNNTNTVQYWLIL